MHQNNNYLVETAAQISGVNPKSCMKCGKCTASCPAFDDMDLSPHMFVSMVEAGRIRELMESTSLWKCLSCFACVERCPRGVEPSTLMEAVRLMVIRRQGGHRISADDIPALLDERIPQQALTSAFRKYSR